MYRAYSAADEVASMLAAKACVGVDGGEVQDPCCCGRWSTPGSCMQTVRNHLVWSPPPTCPATCCVRWSTVCAWCASGSIQRPVRIHFRPQTMVRPRYLTVHPILVKCTSHPALHIVTTDSSECAARPGIMWAARASRGRVGMSSVHV